MIRESNERIAWLICNVDPLMLDDQVNYLAGLLERDFLSDNQREAIEGILNLLEDRPLPSAIGRE